jgi:hypothetical protein
MTATVSEILQAGRRQAGVTRQELWIRYYAIGGGSSPETIDAYLDGSVVPHPADYDVVAQALNDALVGEGGEHAVPYAEDIGL